MKNSFFGEKIWCEMITAVRFGMVGILATVVHIMVVWLLLIFTVLHPLFSNMLAFFIAFGVSFVGNYRWTFCFSGGIRRAVGRFFIISISAFGFNTLLLAFLIDGKWFSPIVAAVLSASVVPLVSFLFSRFWVFKIDN